MSERQPDASKAYDPMEPFRGMRDAYLDAVAKNMVEAVNSEAYAQASGAMLDSTLTMSAPFREAMEKTMLQVLQQLSLPSRQDIVGLAERFTNLEMRLDDMDACLEGIESKLQKSMLPVLEQLLLLTEVLTNLTKRMDAVDSKPDLLQKVTPASSRTAKTAPAAKAVKARRAAGVSAKAPTTHKGSATAKPAQPKKSVARKGTR
jgi:hypothetical protein